MVGAVRQASATALTTSMLSAADPDDAVTVILPEDGNWDFTLDWSDAADIDLWVADEPFDNALLTALTSAQPEHTSGNLPAGTYRIWVQNYAADGISTWRLTVKKN